MITKLESISILDPTEGLYLASNMIKKETLQKFKHNVLKKHWYFYVKKEKKKKRKIERNGRREKKNLNYLSII